MYKYYVHTFLWDSHALPMRYRVVNERRIPVYYDRTEGCLAAAARLSQHAFAATVLQMRTSAYFMYLATDNIFVNPNNYLINCQVIVQSCYFRIIYTLFEFRYFIVIALISKHY